MANLARAQYRLELARKLLSLPASCDMLKHINSLPETRRNELRELVNWVEDYERHE